MPLSNIQSLLEKKIELLEKRLKILEEDKEFNQAMYQQALALAQKDPNLSAISLQKKLLIDHQRAKNIIAKLRQNRLLQD